VYHYVAGTCNNWIRLTFNFPTDAENIPNLRIAFRWRNDNSFPMTTADYTLSAGFNVDNIRIEAAAPPTANFTANKTTVCKYETVTFTNLTSVPCNLATTYTWTITPGTFTYVGGTNANSVNPQVQFTANGTYTVSLTATNAAGTHTFTQTNYITVTACPPIANFTADKRSACALNPSPPPGSPTSITLTDISDLRGQPFTSRTWTITPSTGVNIAPGPNASPVTVTFTNPGTYTVQLSVTTPDGTDDTIATQILNIASCACGGTSTSSVDSTVFYTQDFDGCANYVFSTNGATRCGWRTVVYHKRQYCLLDLLTTGVSMMLNEAGVNATQAVVAANQGVIRACTWDVWGRFALARVPAIYDDIANTDKRIHLNPTSTLHAGALYPYDSIVVQFDLIAYGVGAWAAGRTMASFEYSTDGGATWIRRRYGRQRRLLGGGRSAWDGCQSR
jgi:PKD repeat protein